MPAKKKDNTHLWFEVGGIVCAGIAVFVLCCLISYHPEDPSFETGLSVTPPQIHNWGKQIGAYLSSILFQMLGLGAFAIPAALFFMAGKLLFSPVFTIGFWLRSALYALLFICLETMLSLCLGTLDIYRYFFDAGGAVIGALVSGLLQSTIGIVGTWLVLIITAMLTVMGLTNVSYVTLWNRFLSACSAWVTAPLHNAIEAAQKRWSDLIKKKRRPAVQRTPASPARQEKQAAEKSPPAPQAADAGTIPINIYRENCAQNPPASDSDDTFEPAGGAPPKHYQLPPLDLLDSADESDIDVDRELLRKDAETLIQKLSDFGVSGRIAEINPGPVITRFEFEPASGIKLNRIINLADDLALALKALRVRIAPIPGKAVVGIELPSKKRKTVYFKDIAGREEFQNAKSRLTIGIGKDIAGMPIINDLSRMPHLLVAGTTGSGKSVFINTVICSILFKATPDEVRFLMIDPKRLELFPYDGIPHLLHPVVVNPKKAAVALQWAVEEMDRRYRMLAEMRTRDIDQYNRQVEKILKKGDISGDPPEKMTYIVVVIDELADLMMIAARDVEGHIARLAQMARASGMHLLVATQRPSVDILTGVIKANFPCRVSFQVSSKVDSRTILDTTGSEKLLGMGDMLFLPPGTSRLQRIHGAYISEAEISRITAFIKKQGTPDYDESIVAAKEEEAAAEEQDDEYDELYDKAVALVTDTGQASISMLQRRMRVGYNRAARMIEKMEREGVVGPSDGVKPREVLANKL